MYTPSKLTDTEWVVVESISKEFGYWRREHPNNNGYLIKENELVKLLGIISRLSRGEEVVSQRAPSED